VIFLKFIFSLLSFLYYRFDICFTGEITQKNDQSKKYVFIFIPKTYSKEMLARQSMNAGIKAGYSLIEN